MTYDAIVIGGGIAGCSAAAQLARLGFNTLLLEKQIYPVDKLCGEFLSIEVTGAFRRLDVLQAVEAAGPARISGVFVTAPGSRSFAMPLPGTALGLSRYRLDQLLFQHAARCGAEARGGEAVQVVNGTLPTGFTVETERGVYRARVVLGAYGKRSTLDRKLERPFLSRVEPFVAFKGHFKGVDLGPAIELHAFDGGYCGLSHVEDGRTNACWITDQRVLKASGGNAEAMIEHAFRQNPALAARFEGMERVSEDYLAISQISFAGKDKFDRDVCMVGDAAGMITPLCGDGMAMALRSAEMAVAPATRFLKGEIEEGAFKQHYEQAWQAEFSTRMMLGRIVHHGFIRPPIARSGLWGLSAWPALGRWLVRHTRG